MNKQADIQYTIRGIPSEIDSYLRQKAARQKRSLNQVVIEELARAATGSVRKADFSDLVGKWTPDPLFDEVLASQRQIDWEKWK